MLRILLIAYVVACVVLYLIQKLIIFPGAYIHNRASAHVDAAPGREVLKLRSADGHRVAAIFGAALDPDGNPLPDPSTRPTVLYFYGNGDCIATSLEQFEDFRRLGVNVMIPEYIGYPMSAGSPSEHAAYATAESAYAYLLTRQDVDARQIVVVGRSLGSGPAVDLAARRPVAGLATFSAFTSMDRMARKVMPIFPTSLFLRHHFDNERKIADVTCPIFLAHGTADTLVPFEMMEALAARAKTPVTIVPIPGADHNSVFPVGGAALLDRFGEFLNGIHARTPQSTR